MRGLTGYEGSAPTVALTEMSVPGPTKGGVSSVSLRLSAGRGQS